MKEKISGGRTLRGEVTPPGDKSISHRAIILNSLGEGKALVTNFLPGADCFSTIACLQALGVKIQELAPGEGHPPQTAFAVSGVGGGGFQEPEEVLDAGNSGTTMRLLTGLLAAQPFLSIITGDSSLRSRPMGRIIHPLRLMGAEIWGRGDDSIPPLAIRGSQLQGIEYSLPVASAQLKSAILIAALFARGPTTVVEPAPSRDHTEQLLKAMGARIEKDGLRITLTPAPLSCVDVRVPGDISSAAYWLVAGAIHPNAKIRIMGTGINPTRTGILDVLREMGARINRERERVERGEAVADLSVESSELRGVEVSGDMIPRLVDELPLVAVAASVARGTTVIRDAAELRVKETDRISATVKEFSKLGAKIEELPDGMIVHGERQLRGARCQSHGDHRLAMTLGVAALVAGGETVIEDAQVVEVSYPQFWQDLRELAS